MRYDEARKMGWQTLVIGVAKKTVGVCHPPMTDPECGKSGYFSVDRSTFCHPGKDAADRGASDAALLGDRLDAVIDLNLARWHKNPSATRTIQR
jgi:hypothetical protein